MMDQNLPPTERMPDIKRSEEFYKEERWSARNGVGGFLMLGYALSRTLQVFSRWPGTESPFICALWAIGAMIQGGYLWAHREAYGQLDIVPFEFFLAVQFVAWILSVGRIFITPRDQLRNRSIWELGQAKGFKRVADPEVAGVYSDCAIGGVFIAMFYLLGSPTLAGWYQVILGWSVVCYLFMEGHKHHTRYRIQHAYRRANSFMNERN
jgi:hypothetical protein